jgi:hypothetical protein
VAARKIKAELSQKLWEMAEENLTAEELNNKLLIGMDPTEWTAWHEASDQDDRYHRNCGRGLKKM